MTLCLVGMMDQPILMNLANSSQTVCLFPVTDSHCEHDWPAGFTVLSAAEVWSYVVQLRSVGYSLEW